MNKINLNIIKQFKNAFKFEKEADEESLKIYLNQDPKEEYVGMNWLYECEEQGAAFIGIDDNEVFAVDSEGFLVSVCKGIENIPYDLLKYEEWCKNNGINLDTQKIYHDENGNLFKQYFDKP